MSTPRPEHGFCTDDNARALIVVLRESVPNDGLDDLAIADGHRRKRGVRREHPSAEFDGRCDGTVG